MSVSLNGNGAFVVGGSQGISLSSMFNLTPGTSSPAYLVLSAIDRNEYTAGSTGATGSFTENGAFLGFKSPAASAGDDGRYAGIVFSYQVSTGKYYNSQFGYLDQLTYTASANPNDITSISLFGTNSAGLAAAYASNVYNLAQTDPAGFLGSVTVATQPSFNAAVPAQGTPQSICQVADSFVGKAWNINGCWVLASTIATEAGASLPIQSTMIGVSGQASGEWIVAFNGPTGQPGDWQSTVTAGEIVVIGTASSGHITTCVAGTGSSALLVDNAAFVNSRNQVTNLANDGSAKDVTIAAPHLASQEWQGVLASDVVIYELDTPIVAARSAAIVPMKSGLSVAPLFTASDPAGKSVVQYQVYDVSASDTLSVDGKALSSAHSAAAAITVSSLSLVSDSGSGSDTIDVRAFNGTYWGDWTTQQVSLSSTAASPPVVANQTPSQSWIAGQKISLTLPSNTFSDPQGQPLSYFASLSNGQALPSWLSFNASTKTFSGTVPQSQPSLALTVTAADTVGLWTSETINVSVAKDTLVVSNPTPNQTWVDGQKSSLTLPSSTFSDALGQQLSFVAYQMGGASVTAWMHFNSTTDTFSGTVPNTATGTAIVEVVASNSLGLTATDVFGITFSHTANAGTVSAHVSLVGVGTIDVLNAHPIL